MAWMGGQSVVGKIATLATQYVLSWLLLPEAFGMVGLANTVAIVGALTTQFGLREFLVSRRGEGWIEPALWLALSLSFVSAAAMVVGAPLAARLYDEPRIAGLIIVLACAQPFSALNTVLSSVLQKRLAFGPLSVIGTLTIVCSSAVTVICAKLGLGAYSFVVPVVLASVVQLAATWLVSRIRLHWRPRVALWKYFTGTSGYMFLTNVAFAVAGQVDYVALGLFHPAAAVGIYFFAFSFAVQINRIFWSSFTSILFPLLSKIRDDNARVEKGFNSLTSIISVVFVPMCFLQAAITEPVVHLFFSAKWLAAIPVIQVLSVGMGLHTIAEPCISLLQAQRRFRELFTLTTVWALLFATVVYLAARFGGVLTVAVGVSAFYAIGSPIYFAAIVRRMGIPTGRVAHLYGTTALASGIAAAIPLLILAQLQLSQWATLVVTIVLFVPSYLFLIRMLSPQSWRHTREFIGSYFRAPGIDGRSN